MAGGAEILEWLASDRQDSWTSLDDWIGMDDDDDGGGCGCTVGLVDLTFGDARDFSELLLTDLW